MTKDQDPVVPIVDLEPCLTGRDRPGVVQAIDSACLDIDLLVIKGHGIPQPVVEATFYAFFDLWETTKREIQVQNSRGYSGMARQALAQSRGEQISRRSLMRRGSRAD